MSSSSFNPATVASEEGGGASIGPWLNVMDYGAVADALTDASGAMTIGTNTVTIGAASFTTADIGKTIYVAYAGAVGLDATRQPLVSTITGVPVSPGTQATLADNAQATVSGRRVDWGTLTVAAFNSARAAIPGNTGGTIIVPAGKYLMGSSAGAGTYFQIIRSNVKVVGEGIGTTQLIFATGHPGGAGGNAILVGDGFNTYLNVTISDMTIRDLQTSSMMSGGNNPAAIQVLFINNIRIERCELINVKGNSAINIVGNRDGSQNPVHHEAYITDCIFTGESAGNYIEGDCINLGNYFNVHILRNKMGGCRRHGYEGGGQCYDQWIDGNYVDMVGGAGGLSGINPTGGTRTTVSNNKIYNVSAGMGIDFTLDVSVSGFKIQDVFIHGNHIKCASAAYGIRIQDTGGIGTQGQIDRIWISNNYVEANCGLGVPQYVVPNLEVANNRFNCGGAIIIATASGGAVATIPSAYLVRVMNNYIYGGGKKIIAFDDSFTMGPWGGSARCVVENNFFGSTQFDMAAAAAGVYGGASYVGVGALTVNAGTLWNIGTITMTGVHSHDTIEVIPYNSSAPAYWSGGKLQYWAGVSAANTVQVYAYNHTASNVSVPAGTYVFIVAHRVDR